MPDYDLTMRITPVPQTHLCLTDQGNTFYRDRSPWHTKAPTESCLVGTELEQKESAESSVEWEELS